MFLKVKLCTMTMHYKIFYIYKKLKKIDMIVANVVLIRRGITHVCVCVCVMELLMCVISFRGMILGTLS